MRAQSMATSPPPTTPTRAPTVRPAPRRTARSRSRPSRTPAASSPGMPSLSPSWAPPATTTKSNPWSSSSKGEVAADLGAEPQLDPEAGDPGEVPLHRGRVGSEPGDGAGHHAPRELVTLHERDRVSRRGQLRGHGEGARPAADHRHPGSGRLGAGWGRVGGRRAVRREALDVADRQRLVVVGPHARPLAVPGAGAAQDRRQRVVLEDHRRRFLEPPSLHQPHVLGHPLTHQALVGAGRRDAVEQLERPRGLRPRPVEAVAVEVRARQDLLGVAAEVRQPGGGGRLLGAARGRVGLDGEVLQVGGADRGHRRRGGLQVLAEPAVATRAQQVRAGGHRAHPARQQAGGVEGVGAARERHGEPAAEVVGELLRRG